MQRDIDREAYLSHAADFTNTDRGLIEDFDQWLPGEIIDCHAHCNLAEHAEYKSRAKGATHAHWLSLQAIKEAISLFPVNKQEGIKQKLFHDNAQKFYGF